MFAATLRARTPAVLRRYGQLRFQSTLPRKPRRDLSLPFDPSAIENGWYSYWNSRGLFEPRKDADPTKPAIRMLLPPPNVTGELHIGHALMLSIEDALARYYRMNAHPVIWAPGTDHAGIATQSVVERMLATQRGESRKELGREKFVEEVETWREKYGGRILEQMRTLGTSTTNSREYYTRDKGLSEAVHAAFVRLWEQGLVYRDTRMVNWSVKLQTAVSDIEVTTKEILGTEPVKVDGAEFGVLHKFAFPFVEGEGEIVVSTTRPETIPGDRAVAVHPDDPRYKDLHYKLVRHPLISDLTIPIIPDADLVDPAFGSGAVKITPAHDVSDYAFWKRHSSLCTSPTPKSSSSESDIKKLPIPLISVFDSSGVMLPACQVPTLIGYDRFHIRKRVVKLLKDAGAYRGKVPHDVRLPMCERSGTIIEPMLQPQWYLRMKPLAEKVKEVAERDGLTFVPGQPSQLLWDQWLDGIQDWCLSRQIWWGHRIPAYMVLDPGDQIVRWIAAESENIALGKLTEEEKAGGFTIRQDEDVLDTWFSSGLLPLSTAGWRGGEADLPGWRDNYPLTFIESGGDILFFWLARMAMLCTHFSGQLPFPEIILHPLVCDSTGRKMSKSVGNVLDPLLIVTGRTQPDLLTDLHATYAGQLSLGGTQAADATKELRKKVVEIRKAFPNGIARSGADSLRIALLDYTRQARQINMELRHVDVFRKLAIKIDNAFKFFHESRKRAPFAIKEAVPINELLPHDRYLLYHLRILVETVDTAMKNRRPFEATEAIRAFVYDIFCGVYIEFVKTEVAQDADTARRDNAMSMLQGSLDTFLRLLHPFMPFLSEGLWQELRPAERAAVDGVSIMTAAWPSVQELPLVESEDEMVLRVMGAVAKLRLLEKGQGLVVVRAKDGEMEKYLRGVWETVERIGKFRALEGTVVGMRRREGEVEVEGTAEVIDV